MLHGGRKSTENVPEIPPLFMMSSIFKVSTSTHFQLDSVQTDILEPGHFLASCPNMFHICEFSDFRSHIVDVSFVGPEDKVLAGLGVIPENTVVV